MAQFSELLLQRDLEHLHIEGQRDCEERLLTARSSFHFSLGDRGLIAGLSVIGALAGLALVVGLVGVAH
ncbi:MAG TPA: hypothetical protein VNH82_09915 [Candidatus Dormibacteraeota bacterium]|nr:hypothetical protein [Candidatus Dormibacteraeota bacterium]HVC23724.1 hypothetical protein [Candidatus Dormibacteraeota bacterium]